MLARRPLSIQTGGHEKISHFTDKVFPDIPAFVEYLAMPIENLMKAA